MKLVQLTKAMPHQGLGEGDVINVDQRSAKALIKRGDAKEYKAPDKTAEKVNTVDDIESTAKRGRAVMSVARVGFTDPGPVATTIEEAEDTPDGTPKKAAAKKPPAAPGAQPAGGDAGGGAAE